MKSATVKLSQSPALVRKTNPIDLPKPDPQTKVTMGKKRQRQDSEKSAAEEELPPATRLSEDDQNETKQVGSDKSTTYRLFLYTFTSHAGSRLSHKPEFFEKYPSFSTNI